MAIVFADRVKVRSHSTGTGTFTLGSVVTGFQSFEVIGGGNECYYGIEDALGNWEVGRGTYTSLGTLLARDTVIDSSNNGALVNFPDGGKNAFVTLPSTVAGGIVASAASDSFSTITVAGQSNVLADSPTDTLTLIAGTGIGITTTPSADSITISSTTSLGDLEIVSGPGGVDTLQNATTGQNVFIAATESVADLGDGNVKLQYNPHPDTIDPNISPNSLNVDGYDITLDVGVNTLRLNSEGLDFDEGFKLPRTQGHPVAAATTSIVYTNVAYPRVVKLILKAKLLNDYQACEMMVVRSNDSLVVINHTVYAVIHTSANPFVTYNAQWNNLIGKMEITATNLDATDPIWVESMVIEVLEWD